RQCGLYSSIAQSLDPGSTTTTIWPGACPRPPGSFLASMKTSHNSSGALRRILLFGIPEGSQDDDVGIRCDTEDEVMFWHWTAPGYQKALWCEMTPHALLHAKTLHRLG